MFFENGATIFGQQPDKNGDQLQTRIAQLGEKLKVKNEVLSELMEEHITLKTNSWGDLNGRWASPHIRDQVIDLIVYWSQRAALPVAGLVRQRPLSLPGGNFQ